jgi:hypothetical protein
VSQSSEFCRHNPLCCFSTSVYFCTRIFRFGYTLVYSKIGKLHTHTHARKPSPLRMHRARFILHRSDRMDAGSTRITKPHFRGYVTSIVTCGRVQRVFSYLRARTACCFLQTVKVKVKLSLCLTKYHAMKTYWENGGIDPHILDLGTRWRWVVSFTLRPLYPRERAPDTHWTGGWVGPRVVLDTVVKRKIPSPHRESNPRTPIVQHVA